MAKRKTTRNAQGGGSIRQRKDGRWEARYTVGRDPGTGKQMQKSVYGATQAEVRKKLAQVTAAIDEGTYTEPSKFTVATWLRIWLDEYAKPSIKPLTYSNYVLQCEHHIIPAMGVIKMTALNAHTVQTFYNSLQAGSENKKPLSAKTVRNIHGVLHKAIHQAMKLGYVKSHGVLHKAIHQAMKLGYVKSNPCAVCTLPRTTKKEIKPLDEQDIALFLEAIKGHRYERLYTLALYTGLRQSELIGLMWDSVDFDKGIITIDKQLQREKQKGGKYFVSSTKSDKVRRITVASAVVSLLREQKHEQNKHYMKFCIRPEDNLVFADELGRNLSHKSVYNCFKRIVSKIGLESARFHDLRHSFAVISLESGDDVKTVQENLGHHSAAFTLDVYGHVTEKMKTDSAERMDKFISRIQQGEAMQEKQTLGSTS